MSCEGFPGGSVMKNLSGVQEIQVTFLGQEDALEEETATHSSMLAWRIPWMEEPGGLQSIRSQRATTERLHSIRKGALIRVGSAGSCIGRGGLVSSIL